MVYRTFSAWLPRAPVSAALARRPVAGGGIVWCAVGAAVILSTATAWGQTNHVPVLEERVNLRYRFPSSASVGDESSVRYELTFDATETISRQGRETVLAYRGTVEIELWSTPATSSASGTNATAVNLDYVINSLDLRRDAGRGSYRYLLDSTGLVVSRPGRPQRRYGPQDSYINQLPLENILARPGRLQLDNGALLAKPKSPIFLESIDLEWIGDVLVMSIPALPPRAVRTGRTWKSGMPLLLSLHAEPRIVRMKTSFDSFDNQDNVAQITWEGQWTNLPLRPRPGVHHISSDAMSTALVSGMMRLDVLTGSIRYVRWHVTSRISHLESSDRNVEFKMNLELRPAADHRQN